jgi:glucose-6-phosphate-specific signal transduction histidine kinase
MRRLPLDLELTAFQIAQEGLNNAARHAQAWNVRLEVQFTDEGLTIHVDDEDVPASDTVLAQGERVIQMALEGNSLAIGRKTRVEIAKLEGATALALDRWSRYLPSS